MWCVNIGGVSLPSPGQNLVSDATFRSVLEMEMGSLGRATAETRSRSLVVVKILHFKMVGCFSPTDKQGVVSVRVAHHLLTSAEPVFVGFLPTGERCWKMLLTGSPSFLRDQHSTILPL